MSSLGKLSGESVNGICSIWVFLLLGAEAIKTYRSNPYFEYVAVPPGSDSQTLSLTGLQNQLLQDPNVGFASCHYHLHGCVGAQYELPWPFVWGCNWLFMYDTCLSFDHPASQLMLVSRGPWIHQISGPTREDPAVDRREAEPAWKVAALCLCRPEDLR